MDENEMTAEDWREHDKGMPAPSPQEQGERWLLYWKPGHAKWPLVRWGDTPRLGAAGLETVEVVPASRLDALAARLKEAEAERDEAKREADIRLDNERRSWSRAEAAEASLAKLVGGLTTIHGWTRHGAPGTFQNVADICEELVPALRKQGEGWWELHEARASLAKLVEAGEALAERFSSSTGLLLPGYNPIVSDALRLHQVLAALRKQGEADGEWWEAGERDQMEAALKHAYDFISDQGKWDEFMATGFVQQGEGA